MRILVIAAMGAACGAGLIALGFNLRLGPWWFIGAPAAYAPAALAGAAIAAVFVDYAWRHWR